MRQGHLLGLVIAFSLWLPLPAAGQTCNFFLYPSPLYTDSKAQTRSIYVYASDPNCSWASSGGASWAVTTGSGHADGSGYLDIAISSNTTGAERNANFTIAGQTVVLTQRSTQQVFDDVTPDQRWFEAVGLLLARHITAGVGISPYQYGGYWYATRAEIAVFIVRSVMGGDGFSFSPTPYFSDVPDTHQYFKWIQKLRELGITSGCSPNQYCPQDWITRGQMAVLLIRARYGVTTNFTFSSNPRFTDVPGAHPYYKWIQKLGQEGITAGCSPVEYCPNSYLPRGDAATLVLRSGFNELLPAGSPVISTVTPQVAAPGASLNVTVSGVNTSFVQGSTQLSAGAGITVSNLVVTGPTSLTATLTVDAGALLGPRSLIATTGSQEATLPNGLQVLP